MGWVMLMGEEQRRLTERLDLFFFFGSAKYDPTARKAGLH